MPSKTITSPSKFQETLLEVLPQQGSWTREQYLAITDHTRRLVEYTDGFLEFLPMPTDKHQSIMEFLFLALHVLLKPLGGKVHMSGIRVKIQDHRFREPDVVVIKDASDERRANRYWTGADLVMEVVSPDDPDRDLVQKRRDYAEGSIPEYWIVNPLNEQIIVYSLSGNEYERVGTFARGSVVRSVVLEDFEVRVDDVFDAD